MTESSKASWNSAAGFLAGLAGSTLLAVVWNTLGFGSMPSEVGYELTHYFTPITWPFVIAYTIISMVLGFVTKTTWPVALGMIFTLPIACSVELSQDSTSHNLIPFEILLTWLPGFVLAFGAAFCGDWLRRRRLEGGMSSGRKNAALFPLSLGLSLGFPMESSAQATTPQTPNSPLVPVSSFVVDSFDSVSQWSTNPAQGVAISVHSDSGRHGSGLRVDFEFHGRGRYGIIRREVNLELPANYEFRFALRGDAPTNTLEFKLVDNTGANVWWSHNPYFIFPREWRTVARKKRQICFAWGPAGDRAPEQYDPKPPGCRVGLDIRRVSAIEFAITAGSGGKGSIWIDDLTLSPLEANPRLAENIPSDDDAETQTYFEFQVEKPATLVAGTSMPEYPSELQRFGLAGEVQAQFVVRRSGKVDMDSFSVLKSNHELFTQAVRNWIVGVTFNPGMIGRIAIHQLVQQSFGFAVARD